VLRTEADAIPNETDPDSSASDTDDLLKALINSAQLSSISTEVFAALMQAAGVR
jgi:hypothetical protein